MGEGDFSFTLSTQEYTLPQDGVPRRGWNDLLLRLAPGATEPEIHLNLAWMPGGTRGYVFLNKQRGWGRTRREFLRHFYKRHDYLFSTTMRSYNPGGRMDQCLNDLENAVVAASGGSHARYRKYFQHVYDWRKHSKIRDLRGVYRGSEDYLVKRGGKWFLRIHLYGDPSMRGRGAIRDVPLKPTYIVQYGTTTNGRRKFGRSHSFMWLGERPGEAGTPYIWDDLRGKLRALQLRALGASAGCGRGEKCYRLPDDTGASPRVFLRIKYVTRLKKWP